MTTTSLKRAGAIVALAATTTLVLASVALARPPIGKVYGCKTFSTRP